VYIYTCILGSSSLRLAFPPALESEKLFCWPRTCPGEPDPGALLCRGHLAGAVRCGSSLPTPGGRQPPTPPGDSGFSTELCLEGRTGPVKKAVSFYWDLLSRWQSGACEVAVLAAGAWSARARLGEVPRRESDLEAQGDFWPWGCLKVGVSHCRVCSLFWNICQ